MGSEFFAGEGVSSVSFDLKQGWTKIITPQRAWFQFRLKELWKYRALIYLFFRRDFIASYKQTVLGPLWFVVPPVASTLVFTVVFGQIAKIPTDGVPKILFFLLGTIAWSYFANCISRTSNTFIGNAEMFGKVYFPRLVPPLSQVLNNLATFGIQFVLFLGFLAFYIIKGSDVCPSWLVLMLPVFLLHMAALGLGIGCMVAAMTTRFRDLSMAVGFGMQLWMYASCVVFPLSEVSPQYRWILALNPMVPIIEALRLVFLGQGVIETWQYGLSVIVSAICLFLGLTMFSRMEKTFADTV